MLTRITLTLNAVDAEEIARALYSAQALNEAEARRYARLLEDDPDCFVWSRLVAKHTATAENLEALAETLISATVEAKMSAEEAAANF